ncbi:hypothetical protein [Flavobacterium sp. C4GT6]|uniref:hypothetical protein n=1 Tax=Flavobacterium sp. C4GT6 TaxID=3103818 RepID=UPI002ED23F85
MKKNYFLFLLFICFYANAQAPKGVFLAAGINQASLNSDQLTADGSIGYHLGAAINFGYNLNFNYEFGILYSRNVLSLPYVSGVSSDFTDSGNQKYNVDTIDMNFMFNYYIIQPEYNKVFFGPQAGLTVGITNGEWTPAKGASTTNQTYEYGLTQNSFQGVPDFNLSTSFGIVGGFNDFRASIKYNLGLTNALSGVENNERDQYNLYTGPDFKGKLSSVSFTLYYKIF